MFGTYDTWKLASDPETDEPMDEEEPEPHSVDALLLQIAKRFPGWGIQIEILADGVLIEPWWAATLRRPGVIESAAEAEGETAGEALFNAFQIALDLRSTPPQHQDRTAT